MSQIPKMAVLSNEFKQRMSHHSKHEKSEGFAINSVRETLQKLQLNSSKKKQRTTESNSSQFNQPYIWHSRTGPQL